MHAWVCAHDMSQMGLYVNEENTLLRVIPFGFDRRYVSANVVIRGTHCRMQLTIWHSARVYPKTNGVLVDIVMVRMFFHILYGPCYVSMLCPRVWCHAHSMPLAPHAHNMLDLSCSTHMLIELT